ncbi:uncharacterized protein lectin-46Cb [Drosophila bipectinata]|uniref:uncharacterized protein lectin-46Cb n=1 Tax=Drosophila bipectinata TaxID=42026 RepID=UPI001C89EBAB|nr:uncharacterized protein LOC108131703 [Drosophila bipectinata]
MKHLLTALVAMMSVLPRDHLVAATNSCPRRYLRRINGKCYYFSVKKMNWFGALNNCLRKGLTLADLSNPTDFKGAVGFLSSVGNTEDFWFGGNDLYHEGRFQYISNGRLVRYYSNYSNMLPVEHSECDDCMEVRIRSHINMVAADNCQERQYFICSERYCQDDDQGKKPRHHSHEHLHHFHHDIGESADGEVEEEHGIKQLPIASASASDQDHQDSEEAAGHADVEEHDHHGNETEHTNGTDTTGSQAPGGSSTTTLTPGGSSGTPAAEGAAGATTATPASATAAGGETTTTTAAPAAAAPAT